MSTTTANLGLFKYDTTTDGNLAFNIQTALNDNWDKIDAAVTGGSSRNIGEIVTSTIPLTDAGLHLLDGALIQGSGIYSAFVNYIANLYESGIQTLYAYKYSNDVIIYLTSQTPDINDKVYYFYGSEDLTPTFEITQINPIQISSIFVSSGSSYDETKAATLEDIAEVFNAVFNSDLASYSAEDNIEANIKNYFCTGTEWQSAVTNYGVCGKFVYDSTNNTVRLPKITGIIEGTTDLTALGDLVQAGLPNIYGGTGASSVGNRFPATGAFAYRHDLGSATYGSSGSGAGDYVYFDASTVSSIYGNSSTVQPQAIKVLYYIVIATSTKTDIQVDIDEIVTDLNGKADTSLSNVPNSKGILIESYKNGTEWYRIYSDGWCEQGGFSAPVAQDRQVCQVIFSNSFTNTDYYFNVRYISTSWVNAVIGVVSDTNRTTNSVYIWNYSTYTSGAYWYACGYIR